MSYKCMMERMQQELCWECLTEVILPLKMEFTPRQIAFLLFLNQIRMALTLVLELHILVLISRVSLVYFCGLDSEDA